MRDEWFLAPTRVDEASARREVKSYCGGTSSACTAVSVARGPEGRREHARDGGGLRALSAWRAESGCPFCARQWCGSRALASKACVRAVVCCYDTQRLWAKAGARLIDDLGGPPRRRPSAPSLPPQAGRSPGRLSRPATTLPRKCSPHADAGRATTSPPIRRSLPSAPASGLAAAQRSCPPGRRTNRLACCSSHSNLLVLDARAPPPPPQTRAQPPEKAPTLRIGIGITLRLQPRTKRATGASRLHKRVGGRPMAAAAAA